jgi:putative ABC transport system permease protein
MVVGAGIEGLETYVIETVSKTLGSDSFILSKYGRLGHVSQEEWEKMVRRNKDIRLSDVLFLRKHCSSCDEVAGEITRAADLHRGSDEIFGTTVTGTTANRILLSNPALEEGRYFTEEEVRRSRFVCVIGWEVGEKLFPNLDAVGREIKLGSEPVRVIGVLEKMGSSFGRSLDNTLHLPITAYQKVYGSRSSILIRGHARSRSRFQTALDEARTAMRIRHRLEIGEEDTFGLISTDEINSSVDEFTAMIAIVVVPVTLISLVVSGIVVMNIMLVSVTERTFEIGLRKSLGARRTDILKQFLIESFFLAVSGGLIGLGLATVITRVVESTTPLTMTISPGYVLLSIGVSGGIGILAGIYPSLRAAKLDPISALRAER